MPGKRTVTIKDIARLTGVSKATVSRVLNHKPDVDPATRERILRIVEEEGFVPSIAASDLAGGHSRLIGALVPSFTWPMIPDIMRGVAEAMGTTHYELVLYSINDSMRDLDRSKVIDHILASKLTSGLLAIFPGPVSHHLTKLYKQRFPVVMIDDQDTPTEIPWIKADNVNGAYAAVHHLIQLGHRRIAHIQGPLRYVVSHDRHQGYCQALQEAGMTPDPDLALEGDFTTSGGRACASKLFELPLEKRPTAIFASSDQMAYGVLAAAEEYGISIPQDISLVGFDDLTPSPHVHPPLTTVRQPFAEMGQFGIELLLSMLDKPHSPPFGKNNLSGENNWNAFSTVSTPVGQIQQGMDGNKPIHIAMATTLVVRASSAAPNKLTVGT
jgi:LacI family transcriptional regulator